MFNFRRMARHGGGQHGHAAQGKDMDMLIGFFTWRRRAQAGADGPGTAKGVASTREAARDPQRERRGGKSLHFPSPMEVMESGRGSDAPVLHPRCWGRRTQTVQSVCPKVNGSTGHMELANRSGKAAGPDHVRVPGTETDLARHELPRSMRTAYVRRWAWQFSALLYKDSTMLCASRRARVVILRGALYRCLHRYSLAQGGSGERR